MRVMIGLRNSLLAVSMAFLSAIPSAAHEFWIDPVSFFPAPGDPVQAHLRVGQDFDGSSMVYFPRNFTRFEMAVGDRVVPVPGAMGDRPALSMDPPGQGLGIILHETTQSHLSYREWARFVSFVEHKGFDGALAQHQDRGLPDAGFTELYSRHVKSLIQLGDGQGQDREFGLLTEIVALANPYTDDLSAGLPVQVLLRGAPRANAQVELWQRAPDDSVTVAVLRTDDAGQVTLPVLSGHVYMADAVVLEPIGPDAPRDAVWASYWAALTFAVP